MVRGGPAEQDGTRSIRYLPRAGGDPGWDQGLLLAAADTQKCPSTVPSSTSACHQGELALGPLTRVCIKNSRCFVPL